MSFVVALSVIVNKSVLSVYWAGPIKVVQLVAKYSLLAKHVELFLCVAINFISLEFCKLGLT